MRADRFPLGDRVQAVAGRRPRAAQAGHRRRSRTTGLGADYGPHQGPGTDYRLFFASPRPRKPLNDARAGHVHRGCHAAKSLGKIGMCSCARPPVRPPAIDVGVHRVDQLGRVHDGGTCRPVAAHGRGRRRGTAGTGHVDPDAVCARLRQFGRCRSARAPALATDNTCVSLGVYFLVRNWFRFSGRPERGTLEGAAAVALLAFLPAFVTWSVQVRSDQPALAAAVWGGVFLLSIGLQRAAIGGLLFALALLCSQKSIYPIGALRPALGHGRHLETPRDPGRSRSPESSARIRQILAAGLSGAATLADTCTWYRRPPALSDGTSSCRPGRRWPGRANLVGFRAYSTEVSQGAGAPRAAARCCSRPPSAPFAKEISRTEHLLGTCSAALVLGLAVVLVHGSGYPYFLHDRRTLSGSSARHGVQATCPRFLAPGSHLVAGHYAGCPRGRLREANRWNYSTDPRQTRKTRFGRSKRSDSAPTVGTRSMAR